MATWGTIINRVCFVRHFATNRNMRDENDQIYGLHSVAEALANPKRKFVKLQTTANAAERLQPQLSRSGITPEIVHPKVLDRQLEPDAVHQGALLTAKPLRQPSLSEIARDGTVVILDQVTDPHNVGAIMRSCAAFSVSALITTERHSAAQSGVFFKAASGAFEHVPYVKVGNLARAMEELKSLGFTLIGLDSEAEKPIASVKTTRPLGIVLGAEGKGLRQLTRDTCDVMTRLALPGAIVSLNVSNAAAVALYATSESSPA